MQYSSIKPNKPDICAKKKILKNKKIRKVSFKPRNSLNEHPKAPKLNKNHSNI